MLDAARNIQQSVHGRSRQELETDILLAMGLAHLVQIIGEASRLLSQAVKDAHPRVPWTLIQGLRHRIVHDYDEVNLDTLWVTVTTSVPELIPELEAILREAETPGSPGGC
ncbi:MAG TPA: HepT-like ribonuclease domain-containing protein [Chloroflexota bacterium]|jgi:uncharacterized protein with HEPN domain|nr:HepT-like ribonuclease domain-containing protein [Chloroflexota bacterium]